MSVLAKIRPPWKLLFFSCVFSCVFHVFWMGFHVYFMFLFILFSCWFHRCDRFLEKSPGNVYFLTSVSYALLFFQVCLHEFGHSFSSFFWIFHVFSCFWEGFSLPGDARVVVFPQEYECFGQNPAHWKIALFFMFVMFLMFFMFVWCVFHAGFILVSCDE